MKRLLLMFGLVFLYGCGPTQFQQDMNAHNESMQYLSYRQNAMFSESDQLKEQEGEFIKGLSDTQLAAYQQAVQSFQYDAPTRETARRDLEKVCDANMYAVAMQLLEKKKHIRSESAAIKNEYEYLGQNLTDIERRENRRQDAVRDYMLINAVQNRR